jgi:hypothetical protein
MTILHIDHQTVYSYPHPVLLGPHRLMLRPRESRDIKLLSVDITTRADPIRVQTQTGSALADDRTSGPE